MRFQFNIKYRPEIEAGKLRLTTEYGERAEVLDWHSEFREELPVVVKVYTKNGDSYFARFREDGTSDCASYEYTGLLFVEEVD